jgi:hypothetical protein
MCQGQKTSKGATVAGTLRTWVQDYVRAHRSRPTPPNFKPPAKLQRRSPSPDSDLGPRLASEPQVLERLVAVQPRTIAMVLASGQSPQIKRPGEQLRPSLLSGMRPTYVVVVSTAPTQLDLRLDHVQVRSRDEPVEQVVLRVGVQVSGRDDYARLLQAALVNYSDLDAYLVECVKRELGEKVRRAMGNNALTDLEPSTMERALLDYPMPPSFADGVLDRTSFAVLEVAGRRNGSVLPRSAVPSPRADHPAESRSTTARPERPALDLTMDAGLRRLWQRNADSELLGIAGAQAGSRTTVLAVPVEKPDTAEETRLREAFSRHYAGQHLRLVSAAATTYVEIVRAWFREVAGWPRWVVALTETEDAATLQVQIDYLSPLPPEERRDPVAAGEESDREALRRLLPYERVEFVAADPAD